MHNYNNEKISLRPFMESIKHSCKNTTKEELIDFILYYAENIPAKDRIDFLDNISSFSDAETIPLFDETIMDKFSDLKDAIDTRWESIEDGTYYDDNGWDYYGDEPDFFSEDQKEEIEKYFSRADSLFLAGKFSEAQDIYKELYSLMGDENDSYSLYELSVDIEHRETRARYYRCIYETSAPGERAGNLLEEMNIFTLLNDYRFETFEKYEPLLRDIEDAGTGKLPGKQKFLVDWVELLADKETDRANILLLEAVYLKGGIDGVQALARKWKGRQPRGYLFWINIYVEKEAWNKVIDIAKEALSVLPLSELRGIIAGKLIEAGVKLDNVQIVLEGKRELFYSIPEEENFIGLIKEAKQQDAKDLEIENVLLYLENDKENDRELEIKVLLIKGDLFEAFSKVSRVYALGWSYTRRTSAVLFAGVLSALVIKNIQDAEIIKLILGQYTIIRTYSFGEEETEADSFLFHEILEGLKKNRINDQQQKKYIAWVENLGKKRIDQIVSNKYRKSYSKAAEVLCGLAECFILLGNSKKGLDLIHEYRNVKYSRFSAFRSELKLVLSKSRIIQL